MGAQVTREAGRLYFCSNGNVESVKTKQHGGGGRRVEIEGAYTPKAGRLYYVAKGNVIKVASRDASKH